VSVEVSEVVDVEIAPEAEQYNAELVRRVDLTDSLAIFWVRFSEEARRFEPGQYMTIGVVANGKLVQRPYSVASAPAHAEDGYEMYVRLVDGGKFTPLLWQLPVGHKMRMIGPKGKFTLGEERERTHLFICSGTGNAPFLSMMRQMLVDETPRNCVFLMGVSYVEDLGYREMLKKWEDEGTFPVQFVPTVSRPTDPANAGWEGRTGRVETIVEPVCEELGLNADNTIAYICGNPEMIVVVEELLVSRGFDPAHGRTEQYWPKKRK
jgi:ferredoxin/flavodoxin---NADP+ reductase